VLIKQDCEPIQRLAASASIREKFIKGFGSFTDESSSTKDLSGSIQKLRLLNIHCVECIQEWRLHLESLAKQPVCASFRFFGMSYLRKMKEDFERIVASMRTQIRWPTTTDMFLVGVESITDGLTTKVSNSLLRRI
jgi:hypothetical protein